MNKIIKNYIISYINILSYSINNLLVVPPVTIELTQKSSFKTYQEIYQKISKITDENKNEKVKMLYYICMSYIFFYLLKNKKKEDLKSKKDNEYIKITYNYIKTKDIKYNDLHNILLKIKTDDDLDIDKEEFYKDYNINELLEKLKE